MTGLVRANSCQIPVRLIFQPKTDCISLSNLNFKILTFSNLGNLKNVQKVFKKLKLKNNISRLEQTEQIWDNLFNQKNSLDC